MSCHGKILELRGALGEAPRVIDVTRTPPRVADLRRTIEAATFTGKGDQEAVVSMLNEFNAVLAFARNGRPWVCINCLTFQAKTRREEQGGALCCGLWC